jgi:Tol biopolymer transport system component
LNDLTTPCHGRSLSSPKPITIAQTVCSEDEPRFGPDRKWPAFNSNESGTFQVYLVSLQATDQKRQVSTEGGVQPRWRRDGKEIRYQFAVTADGERFLIQTPVSEGSPTPITVVVNWPRLSSNNRHI